jgi:hypothetical protein
VQTASAVVLAVVCLALRIKGYRLYQAAPAGDESQPPQREILQFGVKHMLIWTTALAPLLLVIQGIDRIVFRRYKIVDLFPGVFICVLTAMVCLATIWLTLGKGNVAVRALIFVLSVVGSGVAMYVLSERLRPIYGNWPDPILINTTVALSRLWGVWFALVGGLLAAMLLFLRAADYRLARRRRQ